MRRAAAIGLGALAVLAAITQGCSCGGDGNDITAVGCGSDCKQTCGPPLPMGMIGAYTSVATAKDGTIWVAGYDDAALGSDVGNYLYGDLVAGKYDPAKGTVAWQTVDGTFARTDGSCPDNDRNGWRGGETESGDDVGLWTSIQLDDSDHPLIAYYDATHMALKIAYLDGDKWSSYPIAGGIPGSDAGRYAKMMILAGNPVVAFAVLEKGNGGAVRSKITLAKAQNPSPHQATDWTFEDVAANEDGPCRAFSCDDGQACLTTGACAPTVGGCTPADCGSGKACVTVNGKATCSDVLGTGYVESYPNGIGDYVSMANGPGGVGLVAYDRVHGNLVAYNNTSGTWASQILDGETGSRAAKNAVDTGDVGIGASLAITANGDWHITYVDGLSESLKYMLVPGGKTPLKPEIVDDGVGLGKGSPPFPDGKHIVGDDSRILVDDAGNVTVLYQDATSGELRVATGAPGANGHTWTVKSSPQPSRFAGFFPQYVPGQALIANWWRSIDHATGDVSGDVAFVTP